MPVIPATWEAEPGGRDTASLDHITAFQPGRHSQILSQKKDRNPSHQDTVILVKAQSHGSVEKNPRIDSYKSNQLMLTKVQGQ